MAATALDITSTFLLGEKGKMVYLPALLSYLSFSKWIKMFSKGLCQACGFVSLNRTGPHSTLLPLEAKEAEKWHDVLSFHPLQWRCQGTRRLLIANGLVKKYVLQSHCGSWAGKWHVESQYPTQGFSQKILREKESQDDLDYHSDSIYPFHFATVGINFSTSLILGLATWLFLSNGMWEMIAY